VPSRRPKPKADENCFFYPSLDYRVGFIDHGPLIEEMRDHDNIALSRGIVQSRV
jgi:hypothetical protein